MHMCNKFEVSTFNPVARRGVQDVDTNDADTDDA